MPHPAPDAILATWSRGGIDPTLAAAANVRSFTPGDMVGAA